MDQIGETRTAIDGFRRLSLTLSLVGLGALIAVLLSLASYGVDLYALSGILAASLFLASNFCFFLVRIPQPWMPIVQAVEVATIGLIAAVVSDPTAYDGMVLVAISVPLLAKHGVTRNRRSMGAVLAGA
ncbi:MAG: hypothetical protein KAU31_00905, partial [Spirochaetaceae bacterium]|nr:hypothetical protein [Spirochaetaceae bacterium]